MIKKEREDLIMLELNKNTFEDEVLKADGYVLVDFGGPTCEPCKALLPHIEGFSKKYGDKIKFTKLDTSKARRLCIAQKVLGLPVIAIYKDGKKVEELVKEEATPENVEAMIQKYI